MVPDKSQFCLQVPNFISKDVEKSPFRSRSRDFCQIFRVSVSKNLVSEKSLCFGFRKFGIIKKVSVSVSVKILVSSFSGADTSGIQAVSQ